MKNLGWILLVFLALPLISSTLIIEDDFEDIYSIGDLVEINFSIERAMSVSGFVEVFLQCKNDEFILKKEYVFVEGGKRKNFYFESPLNIDGDCWIKAVFLNEEERSSSFDVSDFLNIGYTLNDKFFLPEDLIKINGTVEKANGEVYNGILKVSLEELDEMSVEVLEGEFYFEYKIKFDAIPKEYFLKLEVEERDVWDKILNSGKRIEKIEIRPKATSIVINSTEEFNPPYEFSFQVFLYDQVGEKIENGTVVIKLKNPLGDVVYQGEFLVGEKNYYNFSGDSMKGGWTLSAYYEGLKFSKSIYVDENKELFNYVEGNVFVFENVGNVLYEGLVKYSLNNGTFEKEDYLNVSIPVGEKYEYFAYYPGSYNLSIEGKDYGFVHLTGYAVGDGAGIDGKTYFVLGGILLFLFLVWFFVFKKKVFRKMEEKEESKIEHLNQVEHLGNIKEPEEIKTRKVIVKEGEINEPENVNQKTYILFLESSANVTMFSSIIESYGYKMNQVENNLAYTFFNEKEGVNSEVKLYNLARAIKRFSDLKEVKTSIVINRGQFEKKISMLKKFALLNRSLLKYSKGHILMTKKFYNSLKIDVPKHEEVVEVLDRRMEIYLI